MHTNIELPEKSVVGEISRQLLNFGVQAFWGEGVKHLIRGYDRSDGTFIYMYVLLGGNDSDSSLVHGIGIQKGLGCM